MGMLHRRHHSLEACGELDQRRQAQIQNQIRVITRLQSALLERDQALDRVRELLKESRWYEAPSALEKMREAIEVGSPVLRGDALFQVASLVMRMEQHAESETTRAQYIASEPTGQPDVVERSVAENVSRVLSKYVHLFNEVLALEDPLAPSSQTAVIAGKNV